MTPLLATATDWRMTGVFAAAMVLFVLAAKIVSAIRHRPPPGFWMTLLLSQLSMRRARPVARGDAGRTLARFAFATLGFIAWWLLFHAVVKMAGWSGWPLAWLAALQVWLMGEVFGTLVRLLLLPTGQLIPLPHENIFLARGVSDFWGRRWNVWTSDWFREVIFGPLRSRPTLAMVVVFAASGVLHEAVVNLPFWLLTGRSLFGGMMLYFGAQAAGMLVERAWLAGRTRAKRLFAWLVVLGPAPLFVQEPILRALQLWR